jgi:hypothetical protein
MKSVIYKLVGKLGTNVLLSFSSYYQDNDSYLFLNLIIYQIQILKRKIEFD